MSTDPRLPFYDATPRPGQDGGAGVQNTANSHKRTRRSPRPPAHHNAPPGTSEVAAESIAGQTKALCARVLAYIIGRGADGATDDEGEAALGIKPQTYTPRRGELVALGVVADSGRRRKTASGRPAAVWVAVTGRPKADGRAS